MFMKEGQAAPHTSHFLAAQAVRVQTWMGTLKRVKFNTHPFRETTSKLGIKYWVVMCGEPSQINGGETGGFLAWQGV